MTEALTLDCGHDIPDPSYPCPAAGDLLWETEVESQSVKAYRAVAEFLEAAKGGRASEWARGYFGEDYPPAESDAEVIRDIYAVAFNEKGRCVYQCPACGRLYVQRKFFINEWVGYEKAKRGKPGRA